MIRVGTSDNTNQLAVPSDFQIAIRFVYNHQQITGVKNNAARDPLLNVTSNNLNLADIREPPSSIGFTYSRFIIVQSQVLNHTCRTCRNERHMI